MVDPNDVTYPNAVSTLKPLFDGITKKKALPLMWEMCVNELFIKHAGELLKRLADKPDVVNALGEQDKELLLRLTGKVPAPAVCPEPATPQ